MLAEARRDQPIRTTVVPYEATAATKLIYSHGRVVVAEERQLELCFRGQAETRWFIAIDAALERRAQGVAT